MASSLINIASSGLKAANVALSTSSNNISNAYTDGYSRQSVSLAQNAGTQKPYGTIGNGVNIVSVDRAYDSLVTNQLRAASSNYAGTKVYSEQVSQIDNLLSDSDNSLSTLMSSFFSSIQSLSTNASDASARQTVISSAQSMVNQFSSTDKYLQDMDSSINAALKTSVDQINTYSKQIANLNEKIVQLGSGSSSANALLDQRDQLINELNNYVGVTTTTQDSMVSVSLANGMTLVQGNASYDLVTVTSPDDPSRTEVAYDNAISGPIQLSSTSLESGSVSGLLTFRTETLDSARNQLGQLALTLASSFNAQHKEGVDLDGDVGTDFFSFTQPSVISNTNNKGSAALTATYTDTTAVKASDYTLKYTNGAWGVTRTSDGASVDYTTGTDDSGNTTLSFDGVEVAVSGTASSGDKFTLNTVSEVITNMSMVITDTAKIAAALNDSSTGESDNRNAAALLALQDSNQVNGNATFSEAYASLVSEIGVKTQSADTNSTTQSSIVDQLTEKQQSISGVNLDEEYVDLQRYQQYYTANAKILSTAGNIFDSLLAAISG
ncbi:MULTISPECIES: flagellar hook-associated protein FlgK [Lonsdalea]|uniref:Flagellar hook-associated protein FlgK n=2 Tax=Lonsdalea TaxID=1082702 RepID=A0ACD1JA70_9GAMM|nr:MULTISPECIES: flagellar hook-associated protein FlgK [Lonsdalea]OSN01723.1 flagellar hook-associated protein FlgK [Lonsdalea populi]QPQ25393.1 flagellar hook-associated protein FlgK [Lonsdalea populi]RAT11991.1 flagellar hook-associated protein FlgK [Lonsdalea quercina]RAT17236.1 flagellar hook-associated protein FlgK [Lonsdalea quercina]RAT21800.1 flagellar hook-associated protein FlgK [Lonsdalea populi]